MKKNNAKQKPTFTFSQKAAKAYLQRAIEQAQAMHDLMNTGLVSFEMLCAHMEKNPLSLIFLSTTVDLTEPQQDHLFNVSAESFKRIFRKFSNLSVYRFSAAYGEVFGGMMFLRGTTNDNFDIIIDHITCWILNPALDSCSELTLSMTQYAKELENDTETCKEMQFLDFYTPTKNSSRKTVKI